MDESIKKIMTVSLTDKQAFKAYAVAGADALVIQKIEPIKGLFKSWRPKLIEEIKERKQGGFVVVVEELSDIVAQYGIHFQFDDFSPTEPDRINLYVALDWYFYMINMGALVFPSDGERYRLTDQTFDRLSDDKGRIKYNVEWSRFTGAHRAVLLCVMAAAQDFQDEHTLEVMTKRMGFDMPDEYDPLASFRAITVGHDRTRAMKWEEHDQKLIEQAKEARRKK